jgi:O-antigen/teichoic acid export membrane protein
LTGSELSISTDEVGVSAAPPTRRRGLLGRVAAYGASKSTTEGLFALRSVLLAAVLGPTAFGSWALLRIGMRYASLGRLGILRGLELELLHPGGDGDRARAESAAATTLGFILVVCGAVAVAALTLAAITQNPDHRLLLWGLAAAVLADSVYGYTLVCLRCRTTLRRYAMVETATAVLHVVLAAGLAWAWGLAGACIGLTGASLMGIAAGGRWVNYWPALSLEPLRRLFRVGLPITLTTCVGVLLITGDRWIVAGWGGTTMLGYYAFAASLTTAASGLAVIIRTVVVSQVYGETSSAGAAAALRSHLEESLLPFARLLPPLLGALSIMVGPAIAYGMPEYLQAIAPGRIFLLAGTAIGLINLATVGAIAGGHQRRLPLYAGISLVLTAGLSILVLKGGLGLEGVAGAALLGHMLFAGALLRVVARESGVTNPDRLVMNTLVPLAWSAAAVTLVGVLLPDFDVRSAALGLAVYLLLLLPLVAGLRPELRRLRS